MVRLRASLALLVAALANAPAALGCDPLDVNCNPPPPDACASYRGASYALCQGALPSCPNLSGPPLQACLAHGVQLGQSAPASTSTGTASSTSTSTANRALNYSATMTNTSMFDTQVNSAVQVGDYSASVDASGSIVSISTSTAGGTSLAQNDAFAAQNNMLQACTQTNLNGRSDAGCANAPDSPECTGMSGALGNATACALPGPPDANGNPTCLSYGAFGYTLNEWLVFGQQFFNGMTGCFAVGDATDTTGANPSANLLTTRSDRLVGVSSFAAFPPATGSPSPSATGASTISGNSPNTPQTSGAAQTVPRWQALAATSTDGATYLGLENGALIQAAASGQSFLTVFSDSPFAAKLGEDNRTAAEAALSEPAETVAAAKDKEEAARAAGAEGEAATAASASADSIAGRNAGAPAPAGARPSFARYPAGMSGVSGTAGVAGSRGAPSNRSSPSPSQALADARALLGEGAPASVAGAGSQKAGMLLTSPEFGRTDSTLFERVSLSYRRLTPRMKAFEESRTARDVRNTEKPEFFENL